MAEEGRCVVTWKGVSALLRQKLVSHKGSSEAGREEFRHCVSHTSLFSRVSFSKTLKGHWWSWRCVHVLWKIWVLKHFQKLKLLVDSLFWNRPAADNCARWGSGWSYSWVSCRSIPSYQEALKWALPKVLDQHHNLRSPFLPCLILTCAENTAGGCLYYEK